MSTKVRLKGKPVVLATLLAWLLGIILIPGAQTASAAPSMQPSFTGVVEICTATGTVNVRSGPGTNHTISAPTLKVGQKVVVLASQAQWARHGSGGWTSRAFLKCANHTREEVTQSSLPQGYWLHETATLHTDGSRANLYDAITTPMGEAFQPWLPFETQRQGFDVSITQIPGTYTFHGVACFIEIDVNKQGDGAQRTEVATHQNNGVFSLTAEAWARIVCDDSDVAGFSIALGGSITNPAADTNSPYGPRSSFQPNEAAGQFVMQSFDCETDMRLPDYDAVKEPNGDIHQPWLPSEADRATQCFNTAVVLLEASFSFNGIICSIWADEMLEGKGDQGRLVAEKGNGLLFSIDTKLNNKFDDLESWGLVHCPADPHNGFSVRRR